MTRRQVRVFKSRYRVFNSRYYVLKSRYHVLAGYVANFQVDCRDGTAINERMRQVLDEFNVPDICVYADNAFVSVDMLRWCKENNINLCGTTRRTFGFPKDLQFDGMQVCVHLHLVSSFTQHTHVTHRPAILTGE